MAAGQDTAKQCREGRAIDAAFFDLFGTLLDLSALVEDCEQAAPGRGRELAARWRAWQLEFSWLRTTMGTFVDFDRVTADALEAAIPYALLTSELGTAFPEEGGPFVWTRLALDERSSRSTRSSTESRTPSG